MLPQSLPTASFFARKTKKTWQAKKISLMAMRGDRPLAGDGQTQQLSYRNFRFGPSATTSYSLSRPACNNFAAGSQASVRSRCCNDSFWPALAGAGDRRIRNHVLSVDADDRIRRDRRNRRQKIRQDDSNESLRIAGVRLIRHAPYRWLLLVSIGGCSATSSAALGAACVPAG